MLDLENLPPNVVRLAAACMVMQTTVKELMQQSSEVSALFAADAGLSLAQYLEAVDWLSNWYQTHQMLGLRPN